MIPEWCTWDDFMKIEGPSWYYLTWYKDSTRDNTVFKWEYDEFEEALVRLGVVRSSTYVARYDALTAHLVEIWDQRMFNPHRSIFVLVARLGNVYG